jgi:hypothetical protein
MDPGNTLGAIVFLAAGTWLGWKVVQGKAQNFLAAVAGGGTNGGAGHTPPAPPSTPHGPLAGVAPQSSPSSPFTAPAPTVFGDVFGQNGSLYGPQYEGAYGPYSPSTSGAFVTPPPNLGPTVFQSVFGEFPSP